MRKFVTSIAILCIFSSIGYGVYLFGPGYLYGKLIQNSLLNNWYSLNAYSDKFLKSSQVIPFEVKEIKNEYFWRRFNFGNISLSLPIKNPYYFVVPKIQDGKSGTNIGLKITDAKNEMLAEIIFVNSHRFNTDFNSQKIFELPLVQEIISRKTNDEIWHDIFNYDISLTEKNIERMLYSLYILYQRSKYLPVNNLGFGPLEGQEMVSTILDYKDKDYTAELIHSKRGDSIFSIIIVRKNENEESDVIRYKILKDIEHLQNSHSLVDIIIREFKGLSYTDQVDHVGMLYLLSAWSYDFSNKGLLENLIFYLERGRGNQAQLKPLYEYYLGRYGEIYTKRKVENLDLSFEALLKRNITLEEQENAKRKLNPIIVKPEYKPRNLNNEFDSFIENAKVKKSKNSIKLD